MATLIYLLHFYSKYQDTGVSEFITVKKDYVYKSYAYVTTENG